ncbi:hypothetical protein ICE98_01422 [Lactococcus lactis]|nr:hypothetical protein [Lactococcus lactis]
MNTNKWIHGLSESANQVVSETIEELLRTV